MTSLDPADLHACEVHRAALIALGTTLRDMRDPADVAHAAAQVLGSALGVARVGYAAIDTGAGTMTLARDWTAAGVESVVGTSLLPQVAPLVERLATGAFTVVDDVRLDPATAAAAEGFERHCVRSLVNVPVTDNDRLVAVFFVHDTEPRQWTERDLALIGEVANRIRIAFERMHGEAALRESEARFRSMADSAPVMMWVNDATGYCTHLNRRWYEFTGQGPRGGEGYGWLEAVHPDDRPIAEQAFISANADHRDYRVDFRLRRADGVYRWTIDAAAARFADDGEYLGYVGSVIDIDERREAEARLALSEEQLRLATEVAEVGLWDVDPITDTLFWAPRVKAMFGISPDVPVTMRDFYSGVHPDDRVATNAAYEAASDPVSRALYDVEYRTVGKEDGVVRWVAAKGRGQFTADGVCFRVIGTAIDVTARKAAEARLRELNEQLEQLVAERTAERNRVWEMSRDMFAVMGFDGHLKAINPAWETTLGKKADALLSQSFREQVHPDDHLRIEAMMERLAAGETVERFEDRLRHADGSWRWISWTLVPEGDVFYAVGRDVTPEKRAAAELEQAQEALR